MSPVVDAATHTLLPRDTNQALGIAQFAVDFMSGKIGDPAEDVQERTSMFFTDAVICGISAVALGTNAPRVLREEVRGLVGGEDGDRHWHEGCHRSL